MNMSRRDPQGSAQSNFDSMSVEYAEQGFLVLPQGTNVLISLGVQEENGNYGFTLKGKIIPLGEDLMVLPGVIDNEEKAFGNYRPTSMEYLQAVIRSKTRNIFGRRDNIPGNDSNELERIYHDLVKDFVERYNIPREDNGRPVVDVRLNIVNITHEDISI